MKYALLSSVLTIAVIGPVTHAADIDLYNAAQAGTGINPNILFMIDNSANWNAKAGGTSSKRFIEHQALFEIFNEHKYDDAVRAGVMVFSGGNKPDGGKVQKGIRDLDLSYGNSLAELFDDIDEADAIKGTNNAPYAQMMNEAYVYFGGKTSRAGLQDGDHDPAAVSGAKYISPAAHQCGLNYVILIGNGQPQPSDDGPAETLLTGYGGKLSGDPISITPDELKGNWSDEFARFMSSTDVVPEAIQPDKQTVTTYVIDVYDPAESPTLSNLGAHALLKSIANSGNGRYFKAHTKDDIKAAMVSILSELQAVNSVFAATTLPVSVNVRGTNLNQVYMGQFRPDKLNRPRWDGNLKLYQLAVDPVSNSVFLADANDNPVQSSVTGFISSSAKSFWTTNSSYWSFRPSGTPLSSSDSPDGEVVQKGATAQRLRESTGTGDYSGRRTLYTCIDCTGTLSAFDTGNGAISQALLGAATSTERDDLIKWLLGNDNKMDALTGLTEDNDIDTIDVRPSIHGDVLHSTPAVINYNDTGTDGAVMAYYGANDGIIHAVQGGKDGNVDNGKELWGFVAPEFFPRLRLLRENSTIGKPYFADGSIGVYTLDANKNKKLDDTGDKVYLYISMRRGGRFMYALDVRDRTNPRLLWQRDDQDNGYAELGQTWSKPSVARVLDGNGDEKTVVIFGAGYDAAVEDLDSDTNLSNDNVTGHTMGRGIFVVDAETGSVIWQAGSTSGYSGPGIYQRAADMTYSIPSDVSVFDRDGDKLDDRIYVGDTGGQMWRVDIGGRPNTWAVHKLASVGAAAGLAERKFLYPPDVVYGKDATGDYDAVLIGSGDREAPLRTTVTDRFYMFKDRDTGLIGGTSLTIVEGDLADVTSNLIQVGTDAQKASASTALESARGWKLTLTHPGERVVSGSVTVSETTFFNTTQPPLDNMAACANLGFARFYAVNFQDGTAMLENDGQVGLVTEDRYEDGVGGGFPPSPVPVITFIDGKVYQVVISGTKVSHPAGRRMGVRHRVFWYKEID